MVNPSPDFWAGRRVLLTGHTGFKGSWLALWLGQLGAQVTGLALAPATTPQLFGLARVREVLARHHLQDIRDAAAVRAAVQDAHDGRALGGGAFDQGVLGLQIGGQVVRGEVRAVAKGLLDVNHNQTCFHGVLFLMDGLKPLFLLR